MKTSKSTATFNLLAGTTAGYLVAMVFYIGRRWLRAEMIRYRFRSETRAVNAGNTCTVCGGKATRMIYTVTTGWTCRNRKLCYQTVDYAAMLAATDDPE